MNGDDFIPPCLFFFQKSGNSENIDIVNVRGGRKIKFDDDDDDDDDLHNITTENCRL